ncbi:hypothetical protein KCU78_g15, partial [Aureobasidium melanogenum]
MEQAKGRIVDGSVSVKDRMFEVSGQKDSEHKDMRHATYFYMSIHAFVAPRRCQACLTSRCYASSVHDEISSRKITVSNGLDSTISKSHFRHWSMLMMKRHDLMIYAKFAEHRGYANPAEVSCR